MDDGLNGSQRVELWLSQEWFAVPNDLIGGWTVTNADVRAVSYLNWPDRVEVEVADVISEKIARHIVTLHNQSLCHTESAIPA